MVALLTQHALADYVADQKRRESASGDSKVLAVLQGIEARDDLLNRLGEQFDQELMDEAMARVRLRVEPQTWSAFQLTACEGLSADAAAQRLNMRLTAVFKAKSRILQMVREEITRLETPEEQPSS